MDKKFKYKYISPSLEEKREIESIRNQYLPKDKETLKLEELKKLDNKVRKIPFIFSVSIATIGVLLFGTGMSFFLELTQYFYLGIPFSILGILIFILVFPYHKYLKEKLKQKYSKQIIELANEIINNKD